MSDRFERILSLDKELWCKDSPVLIEKGALLKDSYTNKYLVQLKFLNLCSKTVIGLTLKVIYHDKINEKSGETEFTYTDLKAEKGTYFGDNKPLYIPNENAREFEFIVTKVVFDDNSQWNNENKFIEIGETKVSAEEKIIEQLKRDLNTYENISMPDFSNNYWYCACGQFNINSEDECCKCKRNKEELKKVSDINTLKSNLAAYEQKEAERLEKERKKAAEDKKRNKKIFKICLAIAVVAVVGVTGGKAIKKNIDYRHAEALTDSGKYDEATAAFKKLGDYKDSPEMIKYINGEKLFEEGKYDKAKAIFKELGQEEKFKDKLYQQAERIFENRKYNEAITIFEKLGDYKDSKDKIYQCAVKMFENGESYDSVIDILKKLGDYKDSKDKIYQCAVKMFENGESYDSVIDILKKLGDYKDSKDIIYQCGEIWLKNGAYSMAADVFKELSGYKDSNDKYKEATYQHAEKLFENKGYSSAAVEFGKLGDYKDAQSKLAEANAKIEEENAWRKSIYSWYNW